MLKKVFLAVLAAAAALISCGKIESKIDDLDKKIDKIKQETIATINEQLTSVNASIGDLENAKAQIDGKIASLKEEKDALSASQDDSEAKIKELEKQINALEEAKNIITGRIDELNEYVEELKTRIELFEQEAKESIEANRQWAETTLVTLAQWEETNRALAEVKALVSGIDQKLADAINKSEEAMLNWVNNQLEGYTRLDAFNYFCTATNETILDFEDQIDVLFEENEVFFARISDFEQLLEAATGELKTEIENQKKALEAKIAENAAKLVELTAELEKQKAALQETNEKLEAAREELKEGYEKAIKEAILECHGQITEYIQAEIKKNDEAIDAKFKEAQDAIDAISGRVSAVEEAIETINTDTIPAINEQIAAILLRLKALEEMIQSIVYIPDYSDGKARLLLNSSRTAIETESLLLKFLVCPANMADTLVNHTENFSIKAKTLSGSGTPDFFDVTIDKYSTSLISAEEGILGLEIKSSDLPTSLGMNGFLLSISYNDGLNNISSNFVTVAIVNPVWQIFCTEDDTPLKDSSTVFVGIGAQKVLKFEANPAATYNQFSYTSDNTGIATIDNTGSKKTWPQATITGVKEGKVAMHASLPDLGMSYSANVFTFFVQVGDMSRSAQFTPSSKTLEVGENFDLKDHVSATPALTDDDYITYAVQKNSKLPDGVTLSNGFITNNYSGSSQTSCTFVATVINKNGRYDDATATITVTFKAKPTRTITFNKSSYTMTVGETLNLNDCFTLTPARTADDVISFEQGKISGTIGKPTVSFDAKTGIIKYTKKGSITNKNCDFTVTVAATDEYSAASKTINVTFKN